jgi:hypothetical protein
MLDMTHETLQLLNAVCANLPVVVAVEKRSESYAIKHGELEELVPPLVNVLMSKRNCVGCHGVWS